MALTRTNPSAENLGVSRALLALLHLTFLLMMMTAGAACKQTKVVEVQIPADGSTKKVTLFAYCPIALPANINATDEVECGEVSTNLVASDASKGTINVSFFRVKAKTVATRPPLFIHFGGPGSTGMDEFLSSINLRNVLGQYRDLVAIGQRGTEFSVAIPECPWFQSDYASETVITAKSLACKTQLDNAGITYERFSTPAAVRDVEAIRIALGYERISWYAVSYGTTFALEHMRQFGSTVDRAILDSVYPPNTPVSYFADQFLDILTYLRDGFTPACNSITACPVLWGGTLPNFVNLFVNVLNKISVNTQKLLIPDQASPAITSQSLLYMGRQFGMGGADARGIFGAFLTALNTITTDTWHETGPNLGLQTQFATALTPFATDAGFESAAEFYRYYANGWDDGYSQNFTDTLTSFLQCAEDSYANDYSAIALDINQRGLALSITSALLTEALRLTQQCSAYRTDWTQAATNFRSAVTASVPTLVINSRWDSATPLRYAQLAQSSLPNSVMRIVNITSHSVLRFYDNVACDNAALAVFSAALDGNLSSVNTSQLCSPGLP